MVVGDGEVAITVVMVVGKRRRSQNKRQENATGKLARLAL
jgi:hypothetical protein